MKIGPSRLTPEAFDSLLRRLGEDADSSAREYETIRRKLALFFEMRCGDSSDSLADETIDRVASKLNQGEAVSNLRAYVYGVAKRVLLESGRRDARERSARQLLGQANAIETRPERCDARVECLRQCLETLPEENRALIVAYYEAGRGSAEEARKALAERLGLSYGNLKIRAHRIRGKLKLCLGDCLVQRGGPK